MLQGSLLQEGMTACFKRRCVCAVLAKPLALRGWLPVYKKMSFLKGVCALLSGYKVSLTQWASHGVAHSYLICCGGRVE